VSHAARRYSETAVEARLCGGEEVIVVGGANSAGQAAPRIQLLTRTAFVALEWLGGCVAIDDKGFIKAGPDLTPSDLEDAKWPLARHFYLFETSLPSVFAVVDVRSTSVKRIASAVGEGSLCIQLVHKVLAA
jgi:thioredoxin reductase